MLLMEQKELSDVNLRYLLHYAIIHANEVGQPAAQTLQSLVSSCRDKMLIAAGTLQLTSCPTSRLRYLLSAFRKRLLVIDFDIIYNRKLF